MIKFDHFYKMTYGNQFIYKLVTASHFLWSKLTKYLVNFKVIFDLSKMILKVSAYTFFEIFEKISKFCILRRVMTGKNRFFSRKTSFFDWKGSRVQISIFRKNRNFFTNSTPVGKCDFSEKNRQKFKWNLNFLKIGHFYDQI